MASTKYQCTRKFNAMNKTITIFNETYNLQTQRKSRESSQTILETTLELFKANNNRRLLKFIDIWNFLVASQKICKRVLLKRRWFENNQNFGDELQYFTRCSFWDRFKRRGWGRTQRGTVPRWVEIRRKKECLHLMHHDSKEEINWILKIICISKSRN